MYSTFFKRLLDVVISFIGLLLLSSVFIIVTIILFFLNNCKPFFLQERPGKNSKMFKIIKFKTMIDRKDENRTFLASDQKITRTELFIRKYSLDKISQLINVLKGEISIFDPRPLLGRYLQLYNDAQKTRHHVKSGITGWTQVSRRNAISWEKKFKLDASWHVQNISLRLDFKILFLTALKEDVNSFKNLNIPPFTGTPNS